MQYKTLKSAPKDIDNQIAIDMGEKRNGSGNSFFQKMQSNPSISSGLGSVFDTITNMKTDPNDAIAQQQNAIKSGITDVAIKSGNPIAMAVGVGMKALDSIGAMTGLSMDNIDKDAGARFGITGGLNNALGYIPGASTVAGIFAKDTVDADVISQEVQDISGAYGQSYGDLEAAQKLGNKRIFGRNKRKQINSAIEDANEANRKMYDISTTNTYRKQSDYGNDIMQQNLNRYAGSNYMSNALAKYGMKIMSIEQAREILALRQQATDIQAFANGGQINVIPEGARHSRLNHLEDVHDDLSDVTKKGIPVVTPTEDGDLEQVAEVEVGEIILNLEVTKKLEELMKDGSDKAAIEAGKLLAKEIITNTDDKSEEYL